MKHFYNREKNFIELNYSRQIVPHRSCSVFKVLSIAFSFWKMCNSNLFLAETNRSICLFGLLHNITYHKFVQTKSQRQPATIFVCKFCHKPSSKAKGNPNGMEIYCVRAEQEHVIEIIFLVAISLQFLSISTQRLSPVNANASSLSPFETIHVRTCTAQTSPLQINAFHIFLWFCSDRCRYRLTDGRL